MNSVINKGVGTAAMLPYQRIGTQDGYYRVAYSDIHDEAGLEKIVEAATAGKGFSPREIRAYVNTTRMTGAGSLAALIRNRRIAETHALVAMKGQQREIYLTVALTGAQMSTLAVDCFQQYNLKVRGAHTTPHAMANAVRQVFQQDCLNRLASCSRITEVGGNFVTTIKLGRTNAHSCEPIVTQKDAFRRSKKQRALAQWRQAKHSSSQVAALAAYDRDPAQFVCQNKVQDCRHQGEGMLSIDSAWDVPFTDWPKIMDDHGASVVYGAMTCPESFGNAKEGRMPMIEMDWVIDDGKITCRFENDSNTAYVHDFENVKKYLSTAYLKRGGRRYLYRRIMINPAGFVFCFRRLEGEVDDALAPKSDYIIPQEEVYVLKTFSSDYFTRDMDARGQVLLEPAQLEVPRKLFQHVINRVLADGDEAFNMQKIATYIRAYDSSFMINGETIRESSRLFSESISVISVAAYLVAYELRCAGRALVGVYSATERYQQQRESGNYLSSMAIGFEKYVTTVLGLPWKGATYIFGGWIAALLHYAQDVLNPEHVSAVLQDLVLSVPCGMYDLDTRPLVPKVEDETSWYNDILDEFDASSDTEEWKAGEKLALAAFGQDFVDSIDFGADFTEAEPEPLDVEVSGPPPVIPSQRIDAIDELVGKFKVEPVYGPANPDPFVPDEDPDRKSDNDIVNFPTEASMYDTCKKIAELDVATLSKVPRERVDDDNRRALVRASITEWYCYQKQYRDSIVSALNGFKNEHFSVPDPHAEFIAITKKFDHAVHNKCKPAYDIVRLGVVEYVRPEGGETKTVNTIVESARGTFEHGKSSKLPAVEYTDFAIMLGIDTRGNATLVYSKRDVCYKGTKMEQSMTYWPNDIIYGVVCSECKVWNFPAIITRLAGMIDSLGTWSIPDFSLYAGVAGAGKTVRLLSYFDKYGAIVCNTRETTGDIRADAKKKGVFADESLYDLYVKTIDSGVVARMPKCEHLQVDEALMVHSAMLYLCAFLSGAKTVTLYGDPKQIGFIRLYTGVTLLHTNVKLIQKVTYAMCSRRTPAAAIAAVAPVYEHRIKTSVQHRTKNHIKIINHVNGLDYIAGAHYITMYQWEKADVMKYFKGRHIRVSTIADVEKDIAGVLSTHESQGKTWPITVLVRLNATKTGDLFSAWGPHFVVAATRHTKELYYYTKVDDDVCRALRAGNDPDAQDAVRVCDDPSNYITSEDVVIPEYHFSTEE